MVRSGVFIEQDTHGFPGASKMMPWPTVQADGPFNNLSLLFLSRFEFLMLALSTLENV